ncbi:hypothetical protein OH77DRAFT_771054 [Trametes cingulata]|nr:hypothetical protein OH77DRAFT_771054 [Trametes cingulata]
MEQSVRRAGAAYFRTSVAMVFHQRWSRMRLRVLGLRERRAGLGRSHKGSFERRHPRRSGLSIQRPDQYPPCSQTNCGADFSAPAGVSVPVASGVTSCPLCRTRIPSQSRVAPSPVEQAATAGAERVGVQWTAAQEAAGLQAHVPKQTEFAQRDAPSALSP